MTRRRFNVYLLFYEQMAKKVMNCTYNKQTKGYKKMKEKEAMSHKKKRVEFVKFQ